MPKLIKITPTYTYWAVNLTEEQFTQYSSSEAGAEEVKLEVDEDLMNGWWKNVTGSAPIYYTIEDDTQNE
jgi:hypothetical protein